MFHNLIESQSHRKEFKRRSSFFLFTIAAYAVIIFGAGIGSIYAYDAQLEAQANDLELMSWVPPVTPPHETATAVRRPATASNNSRPSSQPVRPVLYENAGNPLTPPKGVSTDPNPIVPAPPHTIIGNYIGDPVAPPNGNGTCVVCNGGDQRVVPDMGTTTPPPPPPPIKPPATQHVASIILSGKATSLPQPMYPRIAKDARVQGSVSIQILVSEDGKVLSAQTVSGNPMLIPAARDAAMRARFSPTMLNGQPVKIQGIITYNFVLQ